MKPSAEKDRRCREDVEVRNQADFLACTADETVNEAGADAIRSVLTP